MRGGFGPEASTFTPPAWAIMRTAGLEGGNVDHTPPTVGNVCDVFQHRGVYFSRLPRLRNRALHASAHHAVSFQCQVQHESFQRLRGSTNLNMLWRRHL